MAKVATKRSLADLSAVHDRKVVVPNKIKAALTTLAASGDDWMYESDFLKLTVPFISNTDIAKYRDQFVEFWDVMKPTDGKSSARRVWFASKVIAAKWKASLSE